MTKERKESICCKLKNIEKIIAEDEIGIDTIRFIANELSSIVSELYSDWYMTRSIRKYNNWKKNKQLSRELLNELKEQEGS